MKKERTDVEDRRHGKGKRVSEELSEENGGKRTGRDR